MKRILFAVALFTAVLDARAATCPIFAAGDLNYISKLNQLSYGCTYRGAVGLNYDLPVITLTNTSNTGNAGLDFRNAGGTALGGFFNDAATGDSFISSYAKSSALIVKAASGNVGIGGAGTRSVNDGTNVLNIYNGTAPSGTMSNGASLYVTTGELYVRDATANQTLLSPHCNRELANRKLCEYNNWIIDTTSGTTGKRLIVDMERMLKALNKKLGGGFLHELPSKR